MVETLETLRLFERDILSTFSVEENKTETESIDARIKSLEEK